MLSPFLTEYQLVDTFQNASKSKFNLECALEVMSNNGIADIVLYSPANRRNLQGDLSLINPRLAYALHVLPMNKLFSVSDFAKLIISSTKTAQDALYSFMAAGFCEYSASDKKWIKTLEPQKIANELYAVEAKLKDWKKALKQAYRYLDYADQAWVLIDEKHVTPAIKNLDEFKRLKVGLASISTQGEIKKIFSPENTKARFETSVWAANTHIAKHIKH
jgi:hypothetical protein